MGFYGILEEEYVAMTAMVMAAYGVERDEAEQELLDGYGIAKPEGL
tara:strand:- start:893 stop:1030 length:138 start_codon:yes stop_codon:yes gene_type:complete